MSTERKPGYKTAEEIADYFSRFDWGFRAETFREELLSAIKSLSLEPPKEVTDEEIIDFVGRLFPETAYPYVEDSIVQTLRMIKTDGAISGIKAWMRSQTEGENK